ncbi:polysaccharide biosynthesis protein [Streptomyces sp. NPDC127098]|uniref:polysaccharide biosynthesis protein n=1 Tax=Streptomyces sp. NPDC127098 TaxID=3347137 RepID=UPI00365DF9CE
MINNHAPSSTSASSVDKLWRHHPEVFLGRSEIHSPLDESMNYLRGKRVLVTGAGGFIGAELCRQISRCGPVQLMMLDRNETALDATRVAVGASMGREAVEILLADIRDSRGLIRLFRDRRPDIVFHAAALKWVPILERFPGEALKTNVLGTQHVLEAAQIAGVERLANVSTDKAAEPISVLGYSKRMAEGLTAAAADHAGRPFVSVRFGNVLGCEGSFLPVFAHQIAARQPVTVTHADVTRYLMTVREAAELVIQSLAIGEPGDVLVMDMGEQVPILDAARKLMERAGIYPGVQYIGLRPGEKLVEELFNSAESDVRKVHPHIMSAGVPPLLPITCLGIDPWGDDETIVAAMRENCVGMAARLIRGARDRSASRRPNADSNSPHFRLSLLD